MKVVCKINNLNSFSDERLLQRLKEHMFVPEKTIFLEIGREIHLEIGREYTVYGVVFRNNSPWYYLCPEEYDRYPTPFAAELFSVSDDRLSSYWKLSTEDHDDRGVYSALVFDQWAKDPTFYELLLDGDSEAEELFEKYRQLMNLE